MSRPKFISLKALRNDIENAFNMWRNFWHGSEGIKPEILAVHLDSANAAEARVNAWIEQVIADNKQAWDAHDHARDKAHAALIALRELYQAKGADEVLDARAKAAKVLGIDD